MQSLTVQLGAWMPDDDKNIEPGIPTPYLNSRQVPLQDALNALYTSTAWRLYQPLAASTGTLAVAPQDATQVDNSGTILTFAAGTNGHLYKIDAGIVTDVSKALYYTAGSAWSFARYGDCLIATNGVDPVQDYDIGTSTAFADLAGAPPKAYVVGIVRDFVVLGNTNDGTAHPYRVQWSAIGNPTQWPAPLTQAARAAQSGYQDNYAEYGTVQAITEGEEFGLIFQQRGIVRMRYIGGDEVFQFYIFERKRGLLTPRAYAQIGNDIFFLSGDGFYRTDGNTVAPIGYGKVNRWFFGKCYDTSKVRCAIDTYTHCVYWSFPTTAGANDYVILYNYAEDAWSYAVDTTYAMFQGMDTQNHLPMAFNATNVLSGFTGTQSGAVLTT